MKIIIDQNDNVEEIEIKIRCKKLDENLIKIISQLKAYDEKFTGMKDGKIHLLDIDDIYYFESVDKKTFIYLKKDIYETSLKLYELEEKFKNTDFFRASKSTIINLAKINDIKPLIGAKLEVTLENSEKLIVSRQYVPILKDKLGL